MDDKHIDCECIIPEEMAKLRGMDYQVNAGGHVISASMPAPFIIDQLHTSNIIDDSQHFFATQFLRMRLMFTEGLRFKGNRFYESPDTEPATDVSALSIPVDAWDYLYVCRSMRNPKDQQIIGLACIEQTDIVTINRLRAMPQRVSHAFSELSRHISALWKSKKDCMEGGCQGCTGKCIKAETRPSFIRPVIAD